MRLFIDAPSDPHWWTPTNREWVRSTLAAIFKKYPRAVVSMVADFRDAGDDAIRAYGVVTSAGLCGVILPVNHSLGPEARKVALIRATLEFGAERCVLFHGATGDYTHTVLASVGLAGSAHIWRPTPPEPTPNPQETPTP